MIDLHTHHERCGHATGSLRDYVLAALDKGVRVLGLSDHTPMFAADDDHALPRVAMPKSQFPSYIAEAVALKAEFANSIEILVSTEADYFRGRMDRYSAALDGYPLDYIIGSVHMFEGRDIFDVTRWAEVDEGELGDVKSRYFRTVAECARSGLFQVIGHVDALKGNFPQLGAVPAAAAADEMLLAIRDSGAAMEINTSGGTKQCGGWYPETDLLERAHHFGVPLTFASDAHVPDRIADQYPEVIEVLRHIGFRSWTVFRAGAAAEYFL
ncbi:histidinol-phosphatase (PHP family) [Micromonospora pallida]|uniref:Histidinol-phosphatase n=1 Tax=Micromonospora pallida TaxID=145854 RepID=A0A1C6RUX0_9ACTN|nr:histidinol-phosphatase [Micromonospora pallida]SCL20810.1 histidinol-phosphatase (PHP family) [Micromonospora pallida]